jgi:NADH-quinone oxidoreductase subunit C
MGLERAEIHEIVKAQFPGAVVDDQAGALEPFVVVKPEVLEELAYFLRDDPRLRMDLLSCVSGVDYPDRQILEVIYCLDSTVHKHWLIVKVPLPRGNPRVRSVEQVWRTADWHERETFDLLGVQFEGHHNLVRILCAEDWEGYPLRKDYVMPETYHGIKNVIY